MNLQDLRRSYQRATLSEQEVDGNPLVEFRRWFENALKAEILEPNAMALGTANTQGQPSVRIVLLKEVDVEGFVFFTNYHSRKGQEIAENQQVGLTFFWGELEQQIRIEGRAKFIAPAASDAYYHSRDRGSRIGAWASPQSQRIADRTVLEKLVQDYSLKFEGLEQIERPPHWGGYCVVPHRIEFWQGRASRLHDRIVYERKDGVWEIYRVAP